MQQVIQKLLVNAIQTTSFVSSGDIENKSDEMTDHWYQILPVPNTVKLNCSKTQGQDKLSVSNVSSGEASSMIKILPATDETLAVDVMFDQNLDRKKFSFGDRVLVNYNSANYPGEFLHIGNNEFRVNVMNTSWKLWRRTEKEEKIFYTSNNIIKRIIHL